MDDSWRRWIAENLLLGTEAKAIWATLVQKGFEEAAARREIVQAAESPYLQGVRRAVSRLAKRDWMLKSLGNLQRMDPERQTVGRRDKLARAEFLRDFYAANRPVVIGGLLDDWPALKKWTPAWLQERFGDREVEVQFGREKNRRYEVESNQHKRRMKLAEYCDLVASGGETNDYYMTANNSSRNHAALRELWDDIVQIPEYLDGNSPQKGFFWFGPAGTITPLHHDLTNNLMAQVYGRKLVKLIPSWDLPYVYNEFHCYTDIDAENVDWGRFPQFQEATVIDVIVHPGEVLFLPLGWWHYVKGLDITMTVSFTNFVFPNDFHSSYNTTREV